MKSHNVQDIEVSAVREELELLTYTTRQGFVIISLIKGFGVGLRGGFDFD